MYDITQIGVRVQAIRIQQNLTQEELAGMIGSDRVVLSRIESGQKNCSINYLIKLAEALNVSTDMLLADDLYNNTMAQVNLLLSDCMFDELSIILDTATAVKESLRKHRHR